MPSLRPPQVYLHDYASYSGEIAHVLPQFLSHGLAVVSYDIRGHGRSVEDNANPGPGTQPSASSPTPHSASLSTLPPPSTLLFRSSGIHGLISSFKHLGHDLQLVLDTIVTCEVAAAKNNGREVNDDDGPPPVFLFGTLGSFCNL